ncbi:---NA--- [Olea europaea subsp. europaea]|uniref:---NA n=1 Tax=Olea europaea subsp. europaea TaxID=158383 RepID=A0A8S0UZN1_OLEEU|nr:---NA--- [Olea europaea subsp. europaea]
MTSHGRHKRRVACVDNMSDKVGFRKLDWGTTRIRGDQPPLPIEGTKNKLRFMLNHISSAHPTNWRMDEYLWNDDINLYPYVLVRIYRN